MPTTPGTSKDSGQFTRPAALQAPWCLFLDFDGTLPDIVPTPHAVNVDPALLNLLRRLERRCSSGTTSPTSTDLPRGSASTGLQSPSAPAFPVKADWPGNSDDGETRDGAPQWLT